MDTRNTRLAIIAAVLLAASLGLYLRSVADPEISVRGQKLLAGLDVDQIADLSLKSAENTVTLRRAERSFEVVEAKGYRAKNTAVNRLLRDLAEATLAEDLASPEDLESLGLGSDADQITLSSPSGEIATLRLGKNTDDGGRFVERRDPSGTSILRTAKRFSPTLSQTTYLETTILDEERSDLRKIIAPDFELDFPEQGKPTLDGTELTNAAVANRLKGLISGLRYEEAFLADDDGLRGLFFDHVVRFELVDRSAFELALASRGEKFYLNVRPLFTIEYLDTAEDDSDEELAEKADILRRSAQINELTQWLGLWLFEISESSAQTLTSDRQTLLGG